MPKNEKTRSEKPKHPAKKDTQQEMQEKYIELQILKQQISSYVEQKQAIDEKEGEMNATIEALKSLPAVKKGEEIWSSLGSGTFVRSDIKDVEQVLIGIGAGIVVRESNEKAVDILQGKLNELGAFDSEIVAEVNKMNSMIAELEPEVQRLAEEESNKK